jgi:hypothetical protein
VRCDVVDQLDPFTGDRKALVGEDLAAEDLVHVDHLPSGQDQSSIGQRLPVSKALSE